MKAFALAMSLALAASGFLAAIGFAVARPCSDFGFCPNGQSPVGTSFPTCGCGTSCGHQQSEACTVSGDDFIGYEWSCACTSNEPVPKTRHDPEPFSTPDGFCAGLVCADGTAPISDAGSCLCRQ